MNESTPPNAPGPAPAGAEPATDEALYAALLRADRSESIGPLVEGLAGELNDLLTKILGGIALAKEGNSAPLVTAEEACFAARELSRRLVAFAKGGDGSRKVVFPREILDDVAKLGPGIAVDAANAGTICVDPAQMAQAFRNLVRNAIEAMPPPPHHPRVQLRAADTAVPEGRVAGLPAGDYVEFEVRDNGSGIAPGDLEKIWEPFFTTRKHGSGLGLPTALAIVRRHGGQIGVDSVPGTGTVFTVFLPRAYPAETVKTRHPSASRFRTGRVLVMDDDPDIRTIIEAMMERLDYKCDLAQDGDEAIALYRRYLDIGRPHDAVVLDLSLRSGIGGEEVFAQLKALDPDVRAIAVSGSEEFAERCLSAGFCGWLAKPFRIAELGEALQAVTG